MVIAKLVRRATATLDRVQVDGTVSNDVQVDVENGRGWRCWRLSDQLISRAMNDIALLQTFAKFVPLNKLGDCTDIESSSGSGSDLQNVLPVYYGSYLARSDEMLGEAKDLIVEILQDCGQVLDLVSFLNRRADIIRSFNTLWMARIKHGDLSKRHFRQSRSSLPIKIIGFDRSVMNAGDEELQSEAIELKRMMDRAVEDAYAYGMGMEMDGGGGGDDD